jgi:hypothetical protein
MPKVAAISAAAKKPGKHAGVPFMKNSGAKVAKGPKKGF